MDQKPLLWTFGVVNHNPLLDTRNYEVQYVDDFMEEMTANHIAENMLSQVYSEGNHFLFIKDITDHCKDSSYINKTDNFLNVKSGNLHVNHTTRGWTLQVEEGYGSVECFPLNYLQQSNPIDLAEYSIVNQIQE